MDVSPSFRLEDTFKTDTADLFDFVPCSDYDLSVTGLGADFSSLDDIVGRTVNNNNVTINDVLSPSWGYNYHDPTLASHPGIHGLEKQKGDKMWGGGGPTTEKVVNQATGDTILITIPNSAEQVATDTSDAIVNQSQSLADQNNLELFNSMLNEKPFDVLVSNNHKSPASDCVSYVSAGYSDSGISTSLEDNPSSNDHLDPMDFDRIIDSAVDSLGYSPTGNLGTVEDPTVIDASAYIGNGSPYIGTTVSQSNDTASILEGALRGTVKRPGGQHSSALQSNHIREFKTLTPLTNMTPLPSLATAFKPESLGLPPSQPQITSTNNVFVTNGYDYNHTTTSDEFTNLDSSFTKLSTASSSTKHQESKSKKRKYTKRGTAEESATKARLHHVCSECGKGFKDKYSVNVHHRTHTGEKPFTCTRCGKSFRQKAHLAKHIQIHDTVKPTGKR